MNVEHKAKSWICAVSGDQAWVRHKMRPIQTGGDDTGRLSLRMTDALESGRDDAEASSILV
jgi:hypothetical protein